MDRCKMLEWVQALCFVTEDLKLYLDTHPCDKKALAMYHEAVAKYMQAKEQFEEKYGPLAATSSMNCENWDWAVMPLPWEGVR